MRTDRWWPELVAVLTALLHGPGASSLSVRQWAERRARGFTDEPCPPRAPAAAVEYVDTVALHAYRTTDAHVEALRKGGMSDDQIFELTAPAAVGAARRRLECAVAAMEEAGE